MCGIAGFVNLNSQTPNPELIKRMTDVIAYRGPDDQGQEISQNAALGNRRLAVIDLSPNGHMPMWDSKKRYCITYNGEIFNFQKLKNQLQHKGYRFKSNSDTEVILNLYIEYKQQCLNMLRGMFAFAIWDKQEKTLFLARDQFGIKPLHYYLDSEVFIFGSEIKSILLHPKVKKQLSESALSHYFSIAFGAIPAPETIFKNIFKLPPVHYAFLRQKRLDIQSYWQASCKASIKTNPNICLNEAISTGRDLIEASVKQQLVSDVPLGTFLSGGLDSSLITALAAQNTKRAINSFSIGFDDPKFDESTYASQVAKHLGTRHHHHVFTPKDMLAILPQVTAKLDEPLGDASILPTFLLSKFTRQQVTVALSGDGGDELFLGYPTYIAHKLGFLLNRFPKPMLNTISSLARASSGLLQLLPMARHSPNLSISYKLERFFEGLDQNTAKQYLNFLGPLRLDLKDKLILNHQEASFKLVENILNKGRHSTKLSGIQLLDFLLYLGEDCLVKSDRASSYNSLELRPPFLNVELVDFSLSLPDSFKLHDFNPKFLLKKIAGDLLPDNIIKRPKKGFGVPIHQWLREDLNPLMHQLLDENRIRKQSIFNHKFITQLMAEHESGLADHRMVLWNLVMFESWIDNWM